MRPKLDKAKMDQMEETAQAMTLVVAGNVFTLAEAQIIVERKGRGVHAFAWAGSEGWVDPRQKEDLPKMPNWYEHHASVLDFDKLAELGHSFSVKPGGHAIMPDFWTYGRDSFPVVSARLKTLLEEADPEGSYFFPCPVHERAKDAPPMDNQIEQQKQLAGGELGADAPQQYFNWVVRRSLNFRKPEGWKLPRDIKPPIHSNKLSELVNNDAPYAYAAQFPLVCLNETTILHQRAVYDRIRAAGMTGYIEAKDHRIRPGENTAHV